MALTGDGRLVCAGRYDGTIDVLEVATCRPLLTLKGHTSAVRAVALCSDGHLLASGSLDGSVKLWDTRDGRCIRTLRAERRYERMDITDVTGITDAQRQALLALGAIEQH